MIAGPLMKVYSRFILFALVALFFPIFRACAAELSVIVDTASTNVTVNAPVTFSISVANSTILDIGNVEVTAAFSGITVTNIGATNNLIRGVNQIITNSNNVFYRIDNLVAQTVAVLTLRLTPTQTGTLTLLVSAGRPTPPTIPDVSQQTVLNVASTSGGSTVDLSLSTAAFPTAVLINDQFSYSLNVANIGSGTAPAASINSQLPSTLSFLSVSPAIASSTVNNNLQLTLGAITNSSPRSFLVTLRAIGSGDLTLVHTLQDANITETNQANNVITNSLAVLPYITSNLVVVSLGDQTFNFGTALFDQAVKIQNIGTSTIPSVRVIMTNAPAGVQLYNATGINNSNPYLATGAVGPGQILDVGLRLFIPNRQPFTPGLFVVEAPGLSIPSAGAALGISTNGNFITLHFPTVAGRLYSLAASDSINFSNRVTLIPSFFGNGATISYPEPIDFGTNRFYRVFENE